MCPNCVAQVVKDKLEEYMSKAHRVSESRSFWVRGFQTAPGSPLGAAGSGLGGNSELMGILDSPLLFIHVSLFTLWAFR